MDSQKVKISISVVFMDLKVLCSGLSMRIQRRVVTCEKCALVSMYAFACGLVWKRVTFNKKQTSF